MPTVHRPRYDLKVISRTSAPDVGGRASSARREPVWRRQHTPTLRQVCTGLREPLIAGTRSLPALGRAAIGALAFLKKRQPPITNHFSRYYWPRRLRLKRNWAMERASAASTSAVSSEERFLSFRAA
jgi:hypothetical protein